MLNLLKAKSYNKDFSAILSQIINKDVVLKNKHIIVLSSLVVILSVSNVYSYKQYQISATSLVEAENALILANSSLKKLEKIKTNLEDESKNLQYENDFYNTQIEDLNNKTSVIETKIKDLDNSKDEIYNEIDRVTNGVDSITPSESNQEVAHVTKTNEITQPIQMSEPENIPNFTPIVMTAFDSNNNKTAEVVSKIETLDTLVDNEHIAYIDVASNVNHRLSMLVSTPSIWPVTTGVVTSEFGFRIDPLTGAAGAFHTAIDIAVPYNTEVYATAPGTVIRASYSASGYGNAVEIDHGNGFKTLYAHNTSLTVSEGDVVERGDIIALSGSTGRSTGPHVHYEVLLNNEYQNPREYLN